MESQQMQQERDLVLPPNTFAYVLDKTKGKVSVYVGPFKTSLSNTDALVTWQKGKFIPTPQTEYAVQSFVEASEGQYIVLTNPTAGENPERFPMAGMPNDATDLDTGRKVVIPGPVTFPLWAGQEAQVIDGHHLRHNQYLVVRVYEPEAAKANAERALVAPSKTPSDEELAALSAEEREKISTPLDTDLTMGQLMVIRGQDVSFYVPPTGIEVVPEYTGQFVRDAATLEQLEYCVLLDENGRKRFEKGPAVVFPKPTETFMEEDGSRKFRAIELNPQSGLYIKVIAQYEDEEGTTHSEGEEMFLTGEDTPIYFPRVEHSIIQYGEKRKHHAIAIPKGEGRYVLNRTKGEVDLVTGPRMFLPDPRTQVVVRRVLPPAIVEVMYPGNEEALTVNEVFAAEQVAHQQEVKRRRSAPGGRELAGDYLPTEETLRGAVFAASATSSKSFGGEQLTRGTEYTPPRTITLDTKYEGAVTVSPWPGYAVLIMDKSGNRRVETGPKNILLKYDESLMVLSLSTGRPKDDHSKLRTPYLRTINNSVSDRVTVETRDLVPVTLDLSLRVNFEGDERERWFDVEDYVALLTDHCRSKLRNLAKRHDIQEFYTQTIDLIRDTLLGEVGESSRAGLSFEENGMRLYDVEVLAVEIEHSDVERLLAGAMDNSLRGAIALSQAEQDTERTRQMEAFAREVLEEQDKTSKARAEIALAEVVRRIAAQAAAAEGILMGAVEASKVGTVERADRELEAKQEHDLLRERNEIELARLSGEVEQMIKRAEALDPQLVQAINLFGDKEFVAAMMKNIAPVALATGATTADTFKGIFKGTPYEGIFNSLAERPFAIGGGNGTKEETPTHGA